MQLANGSLLAEVIGRCAWVTFNRPERRNALSIEMWDGLADLLGGWAQDKAVRVVILRGAGEKAFVAGADIALFETRLSGAEIRAQYEQRTSRGRHALSSFPKPVIACIKGYCLGAGLSIAMEADLRIAAEDSVFAIPAARLGIGYGLEPTARLLTLVGPAHAGMMLLTGRRVGGAEALRVGLVNQLVEKGSLHDEVKRLAESLADNAPLSIRALKLALKEASLSASERNTEALDEAIAACLDSEDYREGQAAFMEKRAPSFAGS